MNKNYVSFLRIGCYHPNLLKGNIKNNLDEIIKAIKNADENNISVMILPPLPLTTPFCGNLFFHDHLYNIQWDAIFNHILNATKNTDVTVLLNYYRKENGKYINSLMAIQNGKSIDSISINHIDNSLSKYFCKGFVNCCHNSRFVSITGKETISVGLNQNCNIEIILDSKPYTIGKYDYYKNLVATKSSENSNIVVFIGSDGLSIVGECGSILSTKSPFDTENRLICDVDLELVNYMKSKNHNFSINHNLGIQDCSDIPLDEISFPKDGKLFRSISKTPFMPEELSLVNRNCEEIFNIQIEKLAQRIAHTHSKTSVLGISGGLDSTLALLVTVFAHEKLGKPLSDIIAVTMPGFGTTDRTYKNALNMMSSLGVTNKEISIVNAVTQHFLDIEQSLEIHDITYENAQARERTQILMDVANKLGGIVVGTGDLSEIALGWCTYNGDHMSMYGCNAGVPKTVIQEIIKWFVEYKIPASDFIKDGDTLKKALLDILSTPISPELLPPKEDGNMNQKTEDKVGPYALHDFFIYHTIRNGASPQKLFFLAKVAFDGIYDEATIKKWLITFYKRFFVQQFKRTCSPDGTVVGSIDLSNENWSMPSDIWGNEWIDEL